MTNLKSCFEPKARGLATPKLGLRSCPLVPSGSEKKIFINYSIPSRTKILIRMRRNLRRVGIETNNHFTNIIPQNPWIPYELSEVEPKNSRASHFSLLFIGNDVISLILLNYEK